MNTPVFFCNPHSPWQPVGVFVGAAHRRLALPTLRGVVWPGPCGQCLPPGFCRGGWGFATTAFMFWAMCGLVLRHFIAPTGAEVDTSLW